VTVYNQTGPSSFSLIGSLVDGLTVTDTRPPPDIRGTYTGSGTLTQTNCPTPGTLGILSSVNISSQTADAFNGTATLTDSFGGSTTGSISGTVTPGGQLSGIFTFTTLVFGTFHSSGDGTFTGQVSGDTLSINFIGQERVGDTCSLTGTLSATLAQSIPDIRGTYAGSGTVTNSLCLISANNGTSNFSVTLSITSQAGAGFSGSGTQTFSSGNVNQITFSGTVAVGGQLSGTFTFTNSLGASGNGTFTGHASGTTAILTFSGRFQVGETCIFVGSQTATR
jgi:hypothetical protein